MNWAAGSVCRGWKKGDRHWAAHRSAGCPCRLHLPRGCCHSQRGQNLGCYEKTCWPLSEPTVFSFTVCCPQYCCRAAPQTSSEKPSCCGSRKNLPHCSPREPINPLTEKHKYSKAFLKKKVLKNNNGYSTALPFFMLFCSARKAVL